MSYFNWDDSYSVGQNTVDDQHKTLVSLINELHEAMTLGKSKQIMNKVLQNLLDYTVSHFSTEEKYMIKYNYEWYLPHKSEHRKFIDQVANFQKGYNEGKMVLSLDVMKFLKDWLVNHILKTDKELGVFLQDKLGK